MFKKKFMKKYMKGFVSLLLVLAVTVGLFVPFDIVSVFAAEEPATGSDIYAILYYIDTSKISEGKIVTKNNVELVFQRGGFTDPDRTVVSERLDGVTGPCIWNDFADRDCRTSPPWYSAGYNYSAKPSHINSIYKVTVKDKIAPTYLSGWFNDQRELVEINNIEKIDTQNCVSFYATFNYSYGIHELDLTSWKTENITSVSAMFNHQGNQYNRGLTKLNISNWTLPKCTNLSSFICESQLEELDMSLVAPAACKEYSSMLDGNKKLKTVKIGPLSSIGTSEPNYGYIFKNCINLESVYTTGEPVVGKVDLSAWRSNDAITFKEMFLNCAKIKEIDFGDNFTTRAGTRDYAFDSTFAGCTSLEKVNLNCCWGGFRAQYPTFKDCTSLQELDLSTINKKNGGYLSSFNISSPINIYEGCNELYRVTFNEKYPPAERAGNSVPPKQTWARIKNADGSDYTGVKRVLSASQLFLDFQPEYAGTWVAVDKIVLNSNGGVTEQQSIDGAKDMALEYNPSDIADPERVGYDFDDWYSEKEDGKGVKLEPGTIAQSWSYYAHWIPHTYTLVVDGNGGTVPEGAEVNGGVISEDRKTITYSGITYPQFVELNSGMFTKSGANQLTSWNTRANGKGNGYSANDSVNKLTPTDGDTVTLFAQYNETDYVVTFDSQGGSAINKKYYNRYNEYGTLPTPEKTASTFLGWFTAAEGGTKITSTTVVDSDKTLYAHWADDPKVYFHPNGDGAKLDGSADTQFKVYSVGQNLGVIPVPDWGTRTFKGWYEDATAETEGTLATSATEVTGDIHYYAHWGYKPVFETDGGNYTSYDSENYPITGNPSYTISVLPEVTKPNYNFDGWYFQYTENDIDTEQKVEINPQTGTAAPIDLSKGTVIKAKWTPSTAELTVSFNADGGFSSRSATKVYAGHEIGELPSASRNGYEFLGWFRDGAAQPDTIESTYTSNTTLTAHWLEKDITLTFNPNGGTMVDSSSVSLPSGHSVSSLPGANRENYSFEGWYPLDSNNELDLTKKLTTSTPITANTTYYAHWVNNEQSNARYKYEIQWDTPSNTEVTNTGDCLVFHPTIGGKISGHIHIHFKRVDGSYPINAEEAVITVPKYIFKDKDGNGIGDNNVTADSDFSVTDDGNGNLIIKNKNILYKNFDLEYHYDVNPLLLEGYTDSSDVYHPEYFRNEFDVRMNIADSTESAYNINYAKTLGVEVYSDATVSAEKTQSSVSLQWDTKWGASVPADVDEYFYVTWVLRGNVSNCTQSYDIMWSEDTVHDGTVIYTENEGAWKTNQSGGTYTAKVVTKHRRDAATQGTNWRNVYNEAILTVKYKSGDIVAKRVGAEANAYIEPQTGGSDSFTKTIRDYNVLANHTKWSAAQDYILNGYYPDNESLNVFPYVTAYVGETPNNAVWNTATGTYSIEKRTINISDGAKGDVLISSAVGADKYKWNSSTNHALGSGDYIFSDIQITLTEYDAVCMDGKWSNPFVHSTVSDYDKVIVRVRTSLNNNLEVCYTGSGSGTHNVTLPAGTYYYEVEHPSSFYKTDMRIEANMSLIFSNKLRSYVSEDVGNGWDTLIKNNSTLKLTCGGDTETVQSKDAAQYDEAWPSIYQFGKSKTALYAGKECAPCTNDNLQPETSTEEFPVVIAGWTHSNGEMKKVVTSGVFYDLLPVECTVDPNSVFVKTRFSSAGSTSLSVSANEYDSQKNSGVLDSGYYTVSFEENYQGSGRTLMTVRVTSPEYSVLDYYYKPVGYNVFYKMKTTFSNIHIHGEELINSVAFMDTTLNQAKPENRYGTAKDLDVQTKPYLLSVDSDQTAFALAKTDCIVPSNYTYGIDAVVQAEGSGSGSNLTKSEIVGLNSHYTYRVSYGESSKTSNLVFYDVLEKCFDDSTSEWTGDFLSVNTELIKNVESAPGTTGNCAPKVYYSVKPKSYFESEDDLDVDDDTVWQSSPPAVLSTVTAVAVDCRKTSTGGDFVLDKKKNLSFYINMTSPKKNVTSGQVTNNEALVKGTNYENSRAISQSTYTDVTIHFADPEFVKSAFPSSGTQANPESVVLNSVLKYKLSVTNPDEYIPMTDVVVEDYFDSTLKLNNTIMVQVGDDEPIAADLSARVSSYSTKKVTVSGEDKLKFTMTISSVSPGETIEITVPVTVSAKPQPDGILTNKAYVTSAYGIDYTTPIESGVTYHKVTSAKAKVIKIKSNGDPLPGAQLQILDENKNPIELYNEGVAAGEGDNNDYFTSTNQARAFDIAPGSYYLHEKALPTGYETPAMDISFRVDVEGIHYVKINNVETEVSRIEMVNVPPYQVIYHTNLPTNTDEIFKTVDSVDLVENKVSAFSEIPTFTGDKYYSFTGWYTQASGGQKVTFDRTYEETTHLYAHWHAYKIIFHSNNPTNANDDVFKTVNPSQGDLNASGGINHFYDIPAFAGDEYVFAGWYHNADYTESSEGITLAADFESDTYPKKAADASDPDYHLYAKWIQVGTVSKDSGDSNLVGGYRGFGLAGVQIRSAQLKDSNYGNEETPGGMRFVASVSEQLLKDIDDVSTKQVTTDAGEKVNVEYGYAVGSERNMAQLIDGIGNSWATPVTGNYKGVDLSAYRLQYKGDNVNGANTTGKNRTAATDYRYITNLNCTSNVPIMNTYSNGEGMVAKDHRNYGAYRLYTLVVTYEDESASLKDEKLVARAYIRYYDANGKLRVFYNDYRNANDETYYGGCMCSYNQVEDIAIPRKD